MAKKQSKQERNIKNFFSMHPNAMGAPVAYGNCNGDKSTKMVKR